RSSRAGEIDPAAPRLRRVDIAASLNGEGAIVRPRSGCDSAGSSGGIVEDQDIGAALEIDLLGCRPVELKRSAIGDLKVSRGYARGAPDIGLDLERAAKGPDRSVVDQ